MTPLEFIVHHPGTTFMLAIVAGVVFFGGMEWVKTGLEEWQEHLEAQDYRRTFGRESYTKADLARLLADTSSVPTRPRVKRG